MMKISEMSRERKIAVVVGNVLFFGGLFAEFVVPGVVSKGLLTAAECAGIAIELLAYCRFGKKVVR